MKKVLFILLGILCAVSAGAVSYASPYRGAGRGVIYTMSSSHNSTAFAGLAQAPVATMGSVSRGVSAGVSSRGVAPVHTIAVAIPAVSPVHGIYTAASAVSGGVTTYDKAPMKPRGGVRTTGPDTPPSPGDAGYCDHCHYEWVDDEDNEVYGGYWVCTECGKEIGECDCETCNCVPIDFNWGAMVFMAVMAAAYAVWKKNRHTMPDNGRC